MPPLARDQTGFLVDLENRELTNCEGRIKCVLVGDGSVGKTSLVISYTTEGFPPEYVPTAFDNYNVVVTVDNHPIRLQLCDTAGQDDFDSLRPLCYPGTDVFLLCFSVVSPTSFYNVADKWIPEIRHHSPSTPVILVGTQCDLRSDVKVLIELANYQEQPVSESEARRTAHKLGVAAYLECSALTQKNLKEVFDTAIVTSLQRNAALQRLTHGGKGKGGGGAGKRLLLKAADKPFFRHHHHHAAGEKGLSNGTGTRNGGGDADVHSSKPMDGKKKGWKKFCCFS